MKEAENPLYSSRIANCVFNAFLCYTAIALNSATIYAMTKTSSLPKNIKTLLLSLVVSDLGVGFIVQPLYIAVLVMKLTEPNFGNNSTHTTTFTALLISAYLLSYASFFSVTALTVDRFLAIHLHLRYQELVTYKRVVVEVVSIWVLSAILSLIRQLVPAKENAFVILATIEIMCLFATAVLYSKIYLAVQHHTNEIHTLQVQQEQNGDITNAARLRKAALATFYVYFAFLICYLPRICIFLTMRIHGESIALQSSLSYSMTMVYFNSSLNPLIYCWKMKHIRHAIMDILRKKLPSDN